MTALARRRSIARRRSSGFSPADLPGLFAWYRSDTGITLTDGRVSGWADQSGQNNHLVQATASRRPDHGVLALNGVPLLGFDSGFGHVLTCATSAGIAAPSFTAFGVFRRNTTSADTIVMFGPAAGGRQCRTFQSRLTIVRGLQAVPAQGPTVIPVASPRVAAFRYSNAGAGPADLYLGGVRDFTTNAGAQAFTNGAIAVGAREAGGNEGWNGHLGDIIGYSRALTDTEVGQVITHLGARFAIPVGGA